MRRVRIAAALVLVAATMTGCSQVAAIAPVGGDRLAEVRFAALDVLVEAEAPIRTAPVCAQEADLTIRCEGDTLDGDVIEVSSPGAEPDGLLVKIAGETHYDGSLSEVLETAMRGGWSE